MLFSISKKYYVGYTSDHITERIKKHNHKGFTGGMGDWTLMYQEVFETKQQALKREKEVYHLV